MTALKVVENYWDERAETYSNAVQDELDSNIAKEWIALFNSQVDLNSKVPLRILDIGTGPGFFARLFASHGHKVEAIDCSPGMIERAKHNTHGFEDLVNFHLMDATSLVYPENSFDVVVTRNLTWTLVDPEKAYSEWYRVLKKDGVLLNFDANWYNYLLDEKIDSQRQKNQADTSIQPRADGYATENQCNTCEQIALMMPLTREARPEWDIRALREIGFADTYHDLDVWKKVWDETEKQFHATSPLFMIAATK